MAPAVVGNHIGMTAEYAGPLLSRMLGRGLVEKPEKKKALYRITQKGKDYRASPPPEPQDAGGKGGRKVGGKVGGKVAEKSEEKTEAEKKEDLAILPGTASFNKERFYSYSIQPDSYRFRRKFRAIVGAEMFRYTPEDEEVKQEIDHILGGNLASHQHGKTLPGKFIDDI